MKKIKDERSDDDDRISQLPGFVAHHILSLLDSPVDLVRMTVLSKNWYSLTASLPILNFNIHKFSGSTESFFKYLEHTISKFCEQNVTTAHTFKLFASIDGPSEVDIIDRCLGLILNKGLQVLVIDSNSYLNPLSMYRLPNVSLSVCSLTSLRIRGCKLPSSLLVDGVKFKSFKMLRLEHVPIDDDELIKRLTTSCPLLEEIIVEFCNGLKRFCVYGLQSLQEVQICSDNGLERIDIEAPNLSFLFVMISEQRVAPYMNLSSCKKLTTLYYYGNPSPILKGLADFSYIFPFLETLFLDLPDKCKNLKLSSHCLKRFVLHQSYCDLDEIDLNTPNLLSFDYKAHSHNPFPIEKDQSPSKACMDCYPDSADTLWFQKLRRFLDKKIRFKELKLCIMADLIDSVELKVINLPPFELEHIDFEPDYIEELSVYLSAVEAVLWCCRPRSLTLESYFPSICFEDWSHIVKFTYEKLLQQEDEDQTNIQIVLSSTSKAKLHFSNLNSLLSASPHDQLTQKVTFIKEEVVQELKQDNEREMVNVQEK